MTRHDTHDSTRRSTTTLAADGGTVDGGAVDDGPPDPDDGAGDGTTGPVGATDPADRRARLRRWLASAATTLVLVGRWLRLVVRIGWVGLRLLVARVDTDRRHGVRRWLLIEGDRLLIAGGFVAVVFAASMVLAMSDVVGIAEEGFVVTLFGGVVSGLFSFVPIVISVNQLAVSRLSGTPEELRDDVDEVREFRRIVERMYAHAHPEADRLVSPTDPDEFLDCVVSVVADLATDLESSVGDAPPVEAYVALVRRQLGHVDEQIDRGDGRLIDLLVALMGDNYSRNVNEARQLRTRYGDVLPAAASDALDDLEELFVFLDVLRQYFKSIYIQTVLSRLSRLIVYTGVASFLLSAFLIVLFAQGRPPQATPLALDLLVSGSLAVAALPFAVLSSFVVQIAAITERTAAPGAFTPPSERPEHSHHREV
jgi:hypothetical protein